MKTTRNPDPCECADPGCAHHKGASTCPKPHTGARLLFRVDMDDRTGTVFCDACADDALDSGLFRD